MILALNFGHILIANSDYTNNFGRFGLVRIPTENAEIHFCFLTQVNLSGDGYAEIPYCYFYAKNHLLSVLEIM